MKDKHGTTFKVTNQEENKSCARLVKFLNVHMHIITHRFFLSCIIETPHNYVPQNLNIIIISKHN